MRSITAHSIVAVIRRELKAGNHEEIIEQIDFEFKSERSKKDFAIVVFKPVVSTGSTPGVELVTGETSNKTWLAGLEVCHLYNTHINTQIQIHN